MPVASSEQMEMTAQMETKREELQKQSLEASVLQQDAKANDVQEQVQELQIIEDKPPAGYLPQSFVVNAGVASEDAVIFKLNCGPLCNENTRIGICAPSLDLQTLDALNDMEQLQANIVRVEEVFEVNGKYYLQYAQLPDHLSTLHSLFEDQEDAILPEEKIKQVIKQLLNLMKVFSGMLKHLHPLRIFLNKNDLEEGFRVLCGDTQTFSEFDLTQFKFGNFITMAGNDTEELQYLTPEVVEKLRTRGLEGNEKKFRKLQDG